VQLDSQVSIRSQHIVFMIVSKGRHVDDLGDATPLGMILADKLIHILKAHDAYRIDSGNLSS